MFTKILNITVSIVFITQSYFKVPKDFRLNPNKRELYQIALNHE